MARDAVWAGSLARVNTFKCFTHVGCGEGGPQVLVAGRVGGTVLSSKRAKKLFNLSGSKTSMSAMTYMTKLLPYRFLSSSLQLSDLTSPREMYGMTK